MSTSSDVDISTLDLETLLNLARVALEDFGQKHRHSQSNGKGKDRADVPPPAEEVAFQMQLEYLSNALRAIEDAKFAKTLDVGAESQHPSLLSDTSDWEAAELRAALALLTKDIISSSDPETSVQHLLDRSHPP